LKIDGNFGSVQGLIGVNEVVVDYDKFKCFVLSLVWRSSVARGTFFGLVDVGPHEKRIASLLNSGQSGDVSTYPIFMIDLQSDKIGCEDMIQQPENARDGGQRVCSFIMGGFMIGIYVGRPGHQPPDSIGKFCLQQSGKLVIMRADAKPILQWWASRLKGAGAI